MYNQYIFLVPRWLVVSCGMVVIGNSLSIGGSEPRFDVRLGRMECLDRSRVNADEILVLVSVAADAAVSAVAGVNETYLSRARGCLHGAGPPAVEISNHYFRRFWCVSCRCCCG